MCDIREEWRQIEGWSDYYVSSQGLVKSIKRGKEKILTGFINQWGYRLVLFNQNGQRKKFAVHKLVANAFLPNPDNLPCVNHKDEDKTNNAVCNLEYCTYKHNNNHGTRNKRISEHSGKAVWMCDKETGEKLKYFHNLSEAERQTGNCHQNIAKVCLQIPKHVTCGGYKWIYA